MPKQFESHLMDIGRIVWCMPSLQTRVWPRRSSRSTATSVSLSTSRLSLIALTATFGVLGLLNAGLSLRTQAGIYLLGMVAMNLPHGGYEHLSNLRRRSVEFQLRYLLSYVAMIGLFVALLFIAPVVGLGLAIAVAVAKGGTADVQALRALTGGEHLRSRPQRWLAGLVRGGAVMVVPMVFSTETFVSFSTIMVGIFDPGALAPHVQNLGTRRAALGVGFAILLAAHLGWGYHNATGSGSYTVDVVETLVLIAYFAVVPVVVAVGLYFPLWYSARQVARATAVDENRPDEATGLLGVLEADDPRLVALGAWGVLVAGAIVTFGLAAAIWTLSPNPLGGTSLLPGLVAFWSIFISIVALPHVVIGGWLDRERGIWYVP